MNLVLVFRVNIQNVNIVVKYENEVKVVIFEIYYIYF